MIKANYHTHTWRCNHAIGTEEQYISQAIQQGMEILGFSDHTPHIFPNGYESRIRMQPSQLAGYTDCLLALRDKYKNDIELHIGLEAEYYPACFSDTIAFLRDHPIEYLILGQHFVENEPDGRYSGSLTTDVDFLKQYCAQSMDAMQTGLFTYFAHPDLIHFVGSHVDYQKYMVELLRETASCGMCAEVNLLGFREGRHYPSALFLEAAAEANCPVILGCDAHTPEGLADTEAEAKLRKMISQFGLTVWDSIPLRPIR